MKYGVLTFSYSGVKAFRERLEKVGSYSINLGDYMQTLAVRNLYERAGIDRSSIVPIDRDTLPKYTGAPLTVVLNGYFFRHCFPIPASVSPIFIGFTAEQRVLVEYCEYFKSHAPIGCRDLDTVARFTSLGIPAFLTGCLTLTFPSRTLEPASNKTIVVYGDGKGRFPFEILRLAPQSIFKEIEFVSQRQLFHNFPLREVDMLAAERQASSLLTHYRNEAALVLTSLHHAATPCAAMGIPTIILRKQDDSRFSHVKSLLPFYLSPDFENVNWAPGQPALAEVQSNLLALALARLDAAAQKQTSASTVGHLAKRLMTLLRFAPTPR